MSERDELVKEWFDEYKGPKWFIGYMLDEESIYNGYIGGLKEQNLCCAIDNKIDTYKRDDYENKHRAQWYIYYTIINLKTDRQCAGFIRTWVDKNFSLTIYKKAKNFA